MSAALLHEVGEALYGPLWQSELARALAVSDRTVRRWAAGTHVAPPRVWADIARLVVERRAALSRLLPAVAQQAESLVHLRESP